MQQKNFQSYNRFRANKSFDSRPRNQFNAQRQFRAHFANASTDLASVPTHQQDSGTEMPANFHALINDNKLQTYFSVIMS